MWWVPLSCWIQSPGWSSQRTVAGFFKGKAAPIGKSTKLSNFHSGSHSSSASSERQGKIWKIVWGSGECEFNSTDWIGLYTESVCVCVCVRVCACVWDRPHLNTVVPDWVESTEEEMVLDSRPIFHCISVKKKSTFKNTWYLHVSYGNLREPWNISPTSYLSFRMAAPLTLQSLTHNTLVKNNISSDKSCFYGSYSIREYGAHSQRGKHFPFIQRHKMRKNMEFGAVPDIYMTREQN